MQICFLLFIEEKNMIGIYQYHSAHLVISSGHFLSQFFIQDLGFQIVSP